MMAKCTENRLWLTTVNISPNIIQTSRMSRDWSNNFMAVTLYWFFPKKFVNRQKIERLQSANFIWMGGKGSDKVARLPNCDSSNRWLPRRSARRTLARLLISNWLRIDFMSETFTRHFLIKCQASVQVNAFLLCLGWRLSGASDHPQRLSTLV